MMRRRGAAVGFVLGALGMIAIPSSGADDEGASAAARIEILEPAAGSTVGATFQASGRVILSSRTSGDPILRVNGADVSIVEGRWVATLRPEREGPFQVRAVCACPGEPATVVERTVSADLTPPSIEIDEPRTEVGVYPGGEGRVVGVVNDASAVRLAVNDRAVEVDPQGEFEVVFLLPAAGELRVEMRAIDAAGNQTSIVRRLRTRADAPAAGEGALPSSPGPRPSPGLPPPSSPAARALADALAWLAAHQAASGAWEGAGFHRWCDGKRVPGPGPEGAGKAGYDPGLTGLSLLAFLGAGSTGRSDQPFGKVVSNGLRYLKDSQDAEGCFGPRTNQHYVYNHAIATLAMVEAYGLTGNPTYKARAQKALDFVAVARNPYFAWRYGVKPGDNDTSVTGWMTMALRGAKRINTNDEYVGKPESFSLDEESFDGIKSWVHKVTDESGRVGYLTRGSGPARTPEMVDRFPGDKSESMTAVGMLARVFLGEDPQASAAIRKGADLCMQRLPRWDEAAGTIDMYYWYYATHAMRQVGGERWLQWNGSLDAAVIRTQRTDGDPCTYKGSWDPIDPWGADGGRVYSTAILALSLQAAEASGAATGSLAVIDPKAAAESKSRLQKLRDRATRWMLLRSTSLDPCGRCGGHGVVGAGVKCPTCNGRGRVFNSNLRRAYLELRSPAARAGAQAKEEFQRWYEAVWQGEVESPFVGSYAIRDVSLADDTHGVVSLLEDGRPARTRWIWAREPSFPKGTWYLYTEAADGPWP